MSENSDLVSRRRFLTATGAGCATAVAGCVSGGSGGETSGTLSIGVIQPLSGDLQYYGQQAIWGFASGLAYKTNTDPLTDISTGSHEVDADGDVSYTLEIRDTQLSPDRTQTLATDLVEDLGVDVLFGPTSSGSAERVISTVVKNTDTPIMVGPAASASVTSSGEFCDDNVFRASENTAMDARSGGRYVAQNTDVENVFLMGADYSFGQSVVGNYRAVLEAEGVNIVGERFVPQGYSEFDGLFENAVGAGADAVVGGFTVATLPNFMTTAANYDVRIFGGFATEITNSVVGGVLGNLLGKPLTVQKIKDAEIGPFTTRYHWNQYDNEINDQFVETYTNAYGKVPDLFTSGTFTAASALVQAVEEGGSLAPDDVRSELTGMTVTDTPKGENGYTFQEYNNQARSAMTVAFPVPTSDDLTEAESWGASIMPESPPSATIDADGTTIPADSDTMNCDLSG
jgi:branched-chain amino acid transport system substrate-binding protein